VGRGGDRDSLHQPHGAAALQFSNLAGMHLIIYGAFLIVVMIYYSGGVAAACMTNTWPINRSPLWRF
jgi:hypothetical protein